MVAHIAYIANVSVYADIYACKQNFVTRRQNFAIYLKNFLFFLNSVFLFSNIFLVCFSLTNRDSYENVKQKVREYGTDVDFASTNSQGHNLYKLQYISLEEVKIVSFQQ